MDEISSSEEKRRFQRVLFDAPVDLSSDNHAVETRLIDISLKGALVRKPEDWQLSIGSQLTLTVTLDDANTAIQMQASVTHIETERVGFTCNEIDMESITHLRRLVELNVGDSSLLERELQALG